MKNTTRTKVTYSLPNGEVKFKFIHYGLLMEFYIQLRNNKCKVISQERVG